MALLEVRDLEVYYGVICALKGISFEVNEGEIVTLIGANGAGKTTTMQSVVGLIPKKSGTVTLGGQDVTKMPCHSIVHHGMTQVPEGRRIFSELTVYENLMMGAYSAKTRASFAEDVKAKAFGAIPKNLFSGAYFTTDKAAFKKDIEDVYQRFPRLYERRNQIAGTLSGGEQQMLAMGRALMSHPKLLMLDEPSMGLAPILVDQIFDIIKELHAAGTTILLVEQNARQTLMIADYAYVLELGKIKSHGTSKELLEDGELLRAYLGG